MKRKYRFLLRMLDGTMPYTQEAKDVSEASDKLAARLNMRAIELTAIMEETAEIWNTKEGKWERARPWWEEDKEPYEWEC